MAKRRANGEGSIRKRSDGRWEGRYTAGSDPETGKRIVKSVLGKTQAEVKEKLRKALEETRELDIIRSDDYTVGEWVQTWFELYSKPNVRPSTAAYYRRFIDCHVIPYIGHIKLNKLTARDIQKLYNDLKDHGRVREVLKAKKPGLSSSYVRGLHMMLHNCFERARKERLIMRNPTEDCIIPKIEKKEMKILRQEDIGAYLKAADARGMLPMFFLELTSGLRKGNWWLCSGVTWILSTKRCQCPNRRFVPRAVLSRCHGPRQRHLSEKSPSPRKQWTCWYRSIRSIRTIPICSLPPRPERCGSPIPWSTFIERS